jgi:hypothetical protein
MATVDNWPQAAVYIVVAICTLLVVVAFFYFASKD